jgi:predicted O-methyltransferase YrrM
LALEGDFVECGVYRGFSTAVVANYLRFGEHRRNWYLYDTFAGIPVDQLSPGHTSPEAYAEPGIYEFVRQRFAKYPNVRVLRGRIPEILDEASPARIAFMHLDMNSAVAEIAALERLYDRLVAGGLIVLDDYGWYWYRAQKAAEDKFFAAHGVRVLELPTGQGLVIKPPA